MRILVNYSEKRPLIWFKEPDIEEEKYAMVMFTESAELTVEGLEAESEEVKEIRHKLWNQCVDSVNEQIGLMKQRYSKAKTDGKAEDSIEHVPNDRTELISQLSELASKLGWWTPEVQSYGADLLNIDAKDIDGGRLSIDNLRTLVGGLEIQLGLPVDKRWAKPRSG